MSERHAVIRLTSRVLLDGAYRTAGDVARVEPFVAEDLVRLGVAEHVAPEPLPHNPPVGDDPSAGSAPAGGEPGPSDTRGGATPRVDDRDDAGGAPGAQGGSAVPQDVDPPAQGSGPAGGESSPAGQGAQVADPGAATHLPPTADSPESTTRVKGVGPATAAALAEAGVYTLTDLAALDDDAIAGLATTRAWASGAPDLSAWREQASALLAADTAQA